MLTDDNAKIVTAAALRVTKAEIELNEAIADRDSIISQAIDIGAKPTELGRLTGLTRARIYQIHAGR